MTAERQNTANLYFSFHAVKYLSKYFFVLYNVVEKQRRGEYFFPDIKRADGWCEFCRKGRENMASEPVL